MTRPLTVAQIGELGLLNRVLRELPPLRATTLRGAGGDAALLTAEDGALAVSTDGAVEGVHFDLGFMTLADAARRSVVGALGDLAAVGAEPRAVLLTCGFRGELEVAAVEAMFRAVTELGDEIGFDLVGGDTVASPRAAFLDVVVIGRAGAPPVPDRRGVQPGDLLAVTGDLGGAAAGLQSLQRGATSNKRPGQPSPAERRFLYPPSRVWSGVALARTGSEIHAMTDISDGLAAELRALAIANPDSELVVDAAHLPLGHGVSTAAQRAGCAPYQFALQGGEDYELLISLPETHLPRARAALLSAEPQTGLTVIGRVRPRQLANSGHPRVFLVDPDKEEERELEVEGFEHFRETSRKKKRDPADPG